MYFFYVQELDHHVENLILCILHVLPIIWPIRNYHTWPNPIPRHSQKLEYWRETLLLSYSTWHISSSKGQGDYLLLSNTQTNNTHHKHKGPTLISMTRTVFDNSFYQIVDGISFFSHSSYAPWGPMNLSLLRFVVIKSWSEHILLANMNLNLKVSQHPQLYISHH